MTIIRWNIRYLKWKIFFNYFHILKKLPMLLNNFWKIINILIRKINSKIKNQISFEQISTIDSNNDKFTIHFRICDHKLKSLYLNFIFNLFPVSLSKKKTFCKNFLIIYQTSGKLARFFFEHPICICKSLHYILYHKKNVINYYYNFQISFIWQLFKTNIICINNFSNFSTSY